MEELNVARLTIFYNLTEKKMNEFWQLITMLYQNCDFIWAILAHLKKKCFAMIKCMVLPFITVSSLPWQNGDKIMRVLMKQLHNLRDLPNVFFGCEILFCQKAVFILFRAFHTHMKSHAVTTLYYRNLVIKKGTEITLKVLNFCV